MALRLAADICLANAITPVDDRFSVVGDLELSRPEVWGRLGGKLILPEGAAPLEVEEDWFADASLARLFIHDVGLPVILDFRAGPVTGLGFDPSILRRQLGGRKVCWYGVVSIIGRPLDGERGLLLVVGFGKGVGYYYYY